MKVIIRNSNKELVGNLMVADSIFTRMKGLLGRDSLPEGNGLWLKPCNGVHTFGMKFSIDVVMLDKENRVIEIKKDLKPNRITTINFGAATVLELPATMTAAVDLKKGDVLDIQY